MADDLDFSGLKKKSKRTAKVNFDESTLETNEAPAQAEQTQVGETENGEDFDAFSDLKKKSKKKKSIPADFGNDPEPDSTGNDAPAAPQVTDVASGDFGDLVVKKKKKKTGGKAFDMEAFEREIGQSDSTPTNLPANATADDDDADAPNDDDAPLGAEGTEEIGDIFASGSGGAGAAGAGGEDGGEVLGKESWVGSTRDYTYPELLGRFYSLLHAHNPELAGDKKKLTLVPPAVSREGTKKTLFANLGDICKRMHRNPKHVMEFLFAELGTSGSVDGSQRLVIKGRYTQKSMENVLRRYIVEYVVCKTCKSPDTLLNKENRLYFVTCESCGSRRSVAPIKTGFQAQIGRRVKPAT